MLRKTMLALAATLAIGTAAFAPTSASAHWGGWHGGWYGWHGWHHVYAGYDGCEVRCWVHTPYGPVLRWIEICD